MQVNAIRNLSYGQSLMSHKAVETPQPEQKPVENQGTTASIYFGHKKNNGKTMRNATMATLGSLALLTTSPMILESCKDDDAWAKAEAYADAKSDAVAEAKDTAYVNTHGKGCSCDSCCHGRDTVYIHEPGDTTYIYLPGDTIKLPGDTVIVDTGSYHVTHDTITKWIDKWQKPIPLDTLYKWTNILDVDGKDPSRINVVNYRGAREWEYGESFIANINLLESSKNILVYDREDLDWTGKHTGWGKDVYRIPTTSFKIKTYSGKTLNSPKGIFYETYSNPYDNKSSIYDNNLVQRYFLQTNGRTVNVYSYDPETGLYREDGKLDKGYLDKSAVGSNILLTDLIASDPSIKWGTDPDYSTEDHIVGAKVVTVNDEELKSMYLRARDDEYAEEHYGVAEK